MKENNNTSSLRNTHSIPPVGSLSALAVLTMPRLSGSVPAPQLPSHNTPGLLELPPRVIFFVTSLKMISFFIHGQTAWLVLPAGSSLRHLEYCSTGELQLLLGLAAEQTRPGATTTEDDSVPTPAPQGWEPEPTATVPPLRELSPMECWAPLPALQVGVTEQGGLLQQTHPHPHVGLLCPLSRCEIANTGRNEQHSPPKCWTPLPDHQDREWEEYEESTLPWWEFLPDPQP